jgi:polyphenol oxidase
LLIERVELGGHVGAWFTGRDVAAEAPAVGAAGNLSHLRPHRPDDLVRARAEVGDLTGTDPRTWHHMRQVHGAAVGIVDAATPLGAEVRAVDALVTAEPDRPLVVQVADCVPVLLAGPRSIGVAHAGRRGVETGVAAAAVGAMNELGDAASDIVAAVGPAIGGCCYELPAELQGHVTEVVPDAAATTTWGTPSVDLPLAVTRQLEAAGVGSVTQVGSCTRCDPDERWFSHRRDASTGRQIGLIVRWSPADPGAVGSEPSR